MKQVKFLQVVDDPNIKQEMPKTISNVEKGWCTLSNDGELKCGEDFKQIKIKTPNYQHALNKLMTIPLQVKDNHYTTLGSREETKILQKALDELHQLKCKYGQVKKELDERKASDRNAFKDGYEQAEFDMQANNGVVYDVLKTRIEYYHKMVLLGEVTAVEALDKIYLLIEKEGE